MNRIKMKQGFTMVELLVVLVIIAILAAVATPLFLANTNRSRAAEAIAAMSLIRQGERDFTLQRGGAFFDIGAGNILNGLPSSVAAGVPTPATAGLLINQGVAQFFSNASYTVATGAAGGMGASGQFANPPVQNFLITAAGAASIPCAGALADCALNQPAIATYVLEMDNSGRAFVSYAAGAVGTWSAY